MKKWKSMLGYTFHLDFGVFSWSSTKQQVVAFSTAKLEYIAATIVLLIVCGCEESLVSSDISKIGLQRFSVTTNLKLRCQRI